MLPLGALTFLKGHRDGVVYVLLAMVSAGAGSAAQPWVGISTLLIGGVLYNLRCSGSERHERELGRLKLDRMALEIETAKAQYRAVARERQPTLPLEDENVDSAGRRKRR